MHYRRKKRGFVAWIPVILVGILIIAAFIIAPSLLPSVPRGPPASSVTDSSLPPAGARVEERTPTTATGPDGAVSERRVPAPGAAPSPAGAGTKRGLHGERRPLLPDETLAAPAGGGARKVPPAGEPRAPAPQGISTGPADEWNGPQAGEWRAPAPEGMAAAPADAGSRRISQADERPEESPTEKSTGATQHAPNAVNAAPEPQEDASDDLSVQWNQ